MNQNKPPVNRSTYLLSYIADLAEGQGRQMQKLAGEAARALSPLFPLTGPAARPTVHLGDYDRRFVEELLWILSRLARRAGDRKASAARRKRACRVFSIMLRFGLMHFHIYAPDDAFTAKMFGPGSGRPVSARSVRAAVLYRPDVFGWFQVGQQLKTEGLISPDCTPEQAAKLAEKAARPLIPRCED